MNIMPFLLFAFVASITPGPTNILILNNNQHFGVRATVPALVSGCIAASAIVLVSGAGAGEVLRQYPLVRQVINPKTWMMALAVVSLFARRGRKRAT